MGKFCMCGQVTCPICKGKATGDITTTYLARGIQKTKPRYKFGGDAIVTKPEECDATVSSGDANVTREVPCSCGCGKTVKVGPLYFSPACRTRKWRKDK